jgi:hypothetical protein
MIEPLQRTGAPTSEEASMTHQHPDDGSQVAERARKWTQKFGVRENEFFEAPPIASGQQGVLNVLDAAKARGELDEFSHRQATRILTHHYVNEAVEKILATE